MIRPGNKQELIEQEKASRPDLSCDTPPARLESLPVPGGVDSIIHEGFTDLWMLITGEEMDDAPFKMQRDGRAFAMFYGGQLRLLESKPSALDTLRSVGVEMF